MDRQFMIKAIEREQERKTLSKYNKYDFESEQSFASSVLAYIVIFLAILLASACMK